LVDGEGRPVRILVTLPWGQRLGGAEAMLQTVLDGAHESAHELELVFFEPGPWPAELIDAGFRVEVVPAGRLRHAHRWLATVLRLARILRRRQPDLILNWAAKTQLYGSPAAVLAGMPGRVLWWQQGIPTGDWIDRCATALPARAVGCYSNAAARAQARLWPTRPTFVVSAGAHVADADATGGAHVADAGAGGGHAADAGACGSHVAGAHAAGPDAASTTLELPAGTPLVGLVGRLQPWKGQDRLLGAQVLLRERGYPFHTVIVGGDAYGLSPEYAGSLPPLISRLGLADSVTMTDQVPDAGPYIERMDILVNASDPEPFGIVLLEAMARGVAVVAVDSGGPAEFIEHGRTGMLAASGEPQALANALEPLLASAVLRRQLGEAGRERFLRDFTDVALRERFFGQLECLVGERPARSAAPV
jgi:glycosyltransferase involved in cell wall biosynthesis